MPGVSLHMTVKGTIYSCYEVLLWPGEETGLRCLTYFRNFGTVAPLSWRRVLRVFVALFRRLLQTIGIITPTNVCRRASEACAGL